MNFYLSLFYLSWVVEVLNSSDKNMDKKFSGRHKAFSRLVTLSIASHCNLNIKANKIYDVANRLYAAALFTR